MLRMFRRHERSPVMTGVRASEKAWKQWGGLPGFSGGVRPGTGERTGCLSGCGGYFFCGFYDKQKEHLVCKEVFSIKENAQYICQRIHVYQENGVLLMDEPICLSESQANSNLVFDFFSLWYEARNGLQAAYYSAEDSLEWNAVDYVQKVTVLNPVHKKTGGDFPTVVCYNRTSRQGSRSITTHMRKRLNPSPTGRGSIWTWARTGRWLPAH